MPASSGVLLVDKPCGPTSHDVVAAARRALGTRRIGHTGTLDPFASGLLLLCIGSATRIAEYLTPLRKVYRAVFRFGAATDTDDRTGRVTASSECWRGISDEQIRSALADWIGEHDQVPPLYSAKKIGGVAMHRLARAGHAPARSPMRVRIHDMRLLSSTSPDADVEIDCSAGTYVRAIARDVGLALGCFAHLAELRRVRIGRYVVEDAVSVDELFDPAIVARAWVSPLAALDHLPLVQVSEADAHALSHGRAISAAADSTSAEAVAVALGTRLLAIARRSDGRLEPKKVFADA